MEKSTLVPLLASVLVVVALIGSAAYVFTSDDTSSEYGYEIYAEVIDANGHVTNVKTVAFTTESKNNGAFINAANQAFADAGINATFSGNNSMVSVEYNGSANNACYYRSGDDWVAITDTGTQYVNNSHLSLMLGNGYISETVYAALSATEKAGYQETGWGGAYAYIKLPDSKAYTYYVEIVGSDGKVSDTKMIDFVVSNELLVTYVDSANAAFTAAGVNAEFTIGDYVTLTYNGSGNNACYYRSADEWKAVADSSVDYINNEVVALMLGNGYINETVYAALSEDLQAGYKETGRGGAYAYAKIPDDFNYTVRYEIVEADGTVSADSYVSFSAPILRLDYYITAFNKAFADAGVPLSLVQTSYVKMVYEGGVSNSSYYYNGSEWTAVTDTGTQYMGNQLVGLALKNGYISETVYAALTTEQQAGYKETGYGGSYAYQKLMDPINYTVRYEIIGADGKVTDNSVLEFTSLVKSLEYYIPAFNAAFADANVPLTLVQDGYVKMVYEGGVSNGSYYYLGGYWLDVTSTETQYMGNELIGLVLNNGYISADVYNVLPEDLQAGYKDTGYGGDYAYKKLMDDNKYVVRYEIVESDGKVSSDATVSFTAPLKDLVYYIPAFNKAFADAGVPLTLVQTSYVKMVYEGGSSNGSYYFNGVTWASVTDTATQYINNGYVGLVLKTGFISTAVYNELTAEEKAGYQETGMGYGYDYKKLMDSNSYDLYTQIVADNGVATAAVKLEFTIFQNTNEYLAMSMNKAFADAGISAVFDGDYYYVIYGEDGINNATFYYDGTAWTAVYDMSTEYLNNSVLAFMLNNGYISEAVYNALTAEQQAGYEYVGYGDGYDYIKMPDVVIA